jgi:hypothetical protein
MQKLTLALAFAFFPSLVLADVADVRPMPRPETVVYVFEDDNDFVTVTVDNRGDSDVTEEFDGNYRLGFFIEVTPADIEAGGIFPYYSFTEEMTGEARETVEFFKDEEGRLHIWFLGSVAMPLVTEDRVTTLGPQVP